MVQVFLWWILGATVLNTALVVMAGWGLAHSK